MATNVKVIHLHYSWLSPPVKLEQATYLYKTITHEFHDRNLLSFLEFLNLFEHQSPEIKQAKATHGIFMKHLHFIRHDSFM
jgi:hypothetical protein